MKLKVTTAIFATLLVLTAINHAVLGQDRPAPGDVILLSGSGGPGPAGNTPTSSRLDEGDEAQEIWKLLSPQGTQDVLRAHQEGRRFLVVVGRKWDSESGRWYEKRRWAGRTVVSGGNQILVALGPARWVEVSNSTPSAFQINQWSAQLRQVENGLVGWLKYEEERVAPFVNDPRPLVQQWAQQQLQQAQTEIRRHRQWIDYFKQLITPGAPQ